MPELQYHCLRYFCSSFTFSQCLCPLVLSLSSCVVSVINREFPFFLEFKISAKHFLLLTVFSAKINACIFTQSEAKRAANKNHFRNCFLIQMDIHGPLLSQPDFSAKNIFVYERCNIKLSTFSYFFSLSRFLYNKQKLPNK